MPEIGEVTIKVKVDCSEALEQLAKLEEAMKRIGREPAVNRMIDCLTDDTLSPELLDQLTRDDIQVTDNGCMIF